MKEIMISIQSKWVAKILNEEKAIEIRKTIMKEWKDYFNNIGIKPEPMKVYIYCTKQKPYIKDFKKYNDLYDENGVRFLEFSKQTNKNNTINGKVVAEFTLNKSDKYEESDVLFYGCDYQLCATDFIATALSVEEINNYGSGKIIYLWRIENLVIYDTPKALSKFGLTKAPQDWCYIKGVGR